ncbi:hypothetical protein FO519_008952 [Halicephalobus sp. NKZ332]|nr:hypothetical protein FO519_008952 [Halicephalobus sp. NKZ332]
MFIIIVLLIFLYFFYHCYWKGRNLPPGPMPLPIIGNLHQLGKAKFVEYKDMAWLREKYGDIATFWAADIPIVVIQDFDLLQDTVIKEADIFSGRYAMGKFNQYVRKGDFGMVFADGDLWKEHRRFALQVFRNFGMGKGLMEEKINLELGYFLDSIEDAIIGKEAEINLIPKTEITVANVINQLLFGFAYHDKEKVQEFSKMKDVIAEHMHLGTYPSVAFTMHFPEILRHLPFFKNRYDTFVGGYYRIIDYCKQQVEKHEESFVEEGEPTDYTDAYLKEAKKRPELFTEVQLLTRSTFDGRIDQQVEPVGYIDGKPIWPRILEKVKSPARIYFDDDNFAYETNESKLVDLVHKMDREENFKRVIKFLERYTS